MEKLHIMKAALVSTLALLASCAAGPDRELDLIQANFSVCRDEMLRGVEAMATTADGRPVAFETFQEVEKIRTALETHYRRQQEKVNENVLRHRPLDIGVVGLSQSDLNQAEQRLAEHQRNSNAFWTQAWKIRLQYTRCAITNLDSTKNAFAARYPSSVYAQSVTPPSRAALGTTTPSTTAATEASTTARASCYSACQQDMTQCRNRGTRQDTCLGLYNSCRSLCSLDSSDNRTSPSPSPVLAPSPTQRSTSPAQPQVARPASNDRLYHPFNTCYRTEPQTVPPTCTTCDRVRVCNICSEPLELSARQFRDGRWGGIMATVQPGQCRGAHYWPGATAHQLHFCRRNDGFDWDRGMCRP